MKQKKQKFRKLKSGILDYKCYLIISRTFIIFYESTVFYLQIGHNVISSLLLRIIQFFLLYFYIQMHPCSFFTYIYYLHTETMQAQYQLLPKRNGKTDGSFKKLNPVKFVTNYYDIGINTDKSKIYQYSFALPEDVPQDSEIYHKSICSIKKILRERIGYIAHSGQMIWGSLALKVPTTLQCKFEENSHKYNFESVVKLTKELDLKELDIPELRAKYLQILNVSLKNTLRSLKLCQLGKPGQYFEKQFDGNQELDSKGLQVLKGFRMSLAPLNSGIYLQVDVCSRVLQSRNLLEIFNGQTKDDVCSKYTGATVITKYGTYRTYKIQQIDYKLNPLSKFYNEKKGAQMTYQEYFKQVYGIKITNTKQPLLHAIKNIEKVIDKETKKIKQVKHYVYLIPELVSPTGMTDQQRADFRTMKALDPFTKLSPSERVGQCTRIIENFNDTRGIIQIKNIRKMDGYCLPRPDLVYSGGTKVQPDNRGNIKHRGVLKQPFHFTDWIFVYSLSKNPKRDDQDADDAVNLLTKSAESYGIKFKDPGFLTIEGGSANDWKTQIKKDVDKNGAPQIVVLYINQYEEKHYGQLKQFLTNQLNCPCQFIRKKTLTNPKGAMSAASKIVIQMNIKVGAVPWEVQKRHEYFKGRNLMYGALSISKGQKGYTLAFVGTINNQCTKVFSCAKYGIKDKENIPVKQFETIFINWAKGYYKQNKKVPDLILLYREGLSIQQTANQVKRMQIPALDAMIQEIGAKTKTNNYRPDLSIVIVNKKVNSRFYNLSKEKEGQNPNKFAPFLTNVDSGSIIGEQLSSQNSYDFHLAAQYVTQGTCTPTLFRVAYDTSKMPEQALISFTFEQCFNYYNWQGAVRVPACLQCADKLSKLVSMSIKKDIVESELTKKHFFL